MHADLDPEQYGLGPGRPRPRLRHLRPAGGRDPLPGGDPRDPARRLLPDRSASSTCTSRSPEEKRWIQHHVEGVSQGDDAGGAAAHPRPAERRRGLRDASCTPALRGPEALRPRGRRVGDPVPRRRARRGGPRRDRRGRPRHGPPRPAERARQHRRQVLRRDLRRIRGEPRPRDRPGVGRREVPQGRRGHVRRGRDGTSLRVSLASNPSHLEAVDPVVEGIVRGPSRIGEPRSEGLLRPAAARPRRRRVRRAGRRGRDAQPVAAAGLPHRRHGPPRHQQPARLHDAPDRGTVVGVPDRRRQDGPGADLPRERRRPRGVRARRPTRLRVSARRSTRTSSSTSSATGGTATTRATTRATPSRSCTRRSTTTARCASSTPRRWSPAATSRDAEAEQALADFHGRLQAALDETRSAAPPRVDRLARADGAASRPAPALRPASTRPLLGAVVRRLGGHAGGLHRPPEARPPARPARRRSGGRARSTGPSPRRSPSASLLLEGTDVRVTGQDTRRGTFSQRHAVLVDYADRRRVHAPGLARRVGRR